MNHEAVKIALANADAAIDQVDAYEDSIAAYAQNVKDTLVEQGLDAFRREALVRYYTRVAELIESGADIK